MRQSGNLALLSPLPLTLSSQPPNPPTPPPDKLFIACFCNTFHCFSYYLFIYCSYAISQFQFYFILFFSLHSIFLLYFQFGPIQYTYTHTPVQYPCLECMCVQIFSKYNIPPLSIHSICCSSYAYLRLYFNMH